MRQEVVAASGRPEEAFAWILEVQKKDTAFESLGDSGIFASLDVKLAAAITKIAKAEVERKLSRLADELAKDGRLLKGRQCLFVLYEQFKLDEAAGAIFSLADLLSVQYRGDADLATFMDNWDSVLCGMEQEPVTEVKETLFLRELRKSTVLREEVLHYERCPPGHADKTTSSSGTS